MKRLGVQWGRLALIISVAALGLPFEGHAAAREAKVSSVTGTVTGAQAGQSVGAGGVITTGADSSADLDLGVDLGAVKVRPNSEVAIDRINGEKTGVESVVDVQLNLRSGSISGRVNKLSELSKFEIKIPSGVVGIDATQKPVMFLVDADGATRVLQGRAVVVFTRPTGEVVSQSLEGGFMFVPATAAVAALPPAEGEAISKSVKPAPAKFTPAPRLREVLPRDLETGSIGKIVAIPPERLAQAVAEVISISAVGTDEASVQRITKSFEIFGRDFFISPPFAEGGDGN